MRVRYIFVCEWILLLVVGLLPADEVRYELTYAPAPVDNPLKGLVPYAGDRRDQFPHSMEFGYLPLSSLVTGYDQYNWQPLEALLSDCASRGHQTVFRVYVEYPGKADGIPAFLIEEGLKVHEYLDNSSKPPVQNVTPDYADERLRKVLVQFIKVLGSRYDGDPRIGFITAGLLGHWGEWHTYPKEELFANKSVQIEVLDAYESAFKISPVLLRYPAGDNDGVYAPTVHRPFGYHDDSFAWATLDTRRKGAEWFFMALMRQAGDDAVSTWKSRPIGGEIRPEAWGTVFDEHPTNKQIQDFRHCVEATHASWLMDSGMFRGGSTSATRRERAIEEVRRMGYEFFVSAVTTGPLSEGKMQIVVELKNHGVAPFYYDWPVEFAIIANNKPVKVWKTDHRLTGILPGKDANTWQEIVDLHDVAGGEYSVGLRVANPLPTGHPVRFANQTQDADLRGWLTLVKLTKPN